jgi:hypothetical protein
MLCSGDAGESTTLTATDAYGQSLKFEMLATFEENPELKADFEKQSAATESWQQPEWKILVRSRPKFKNGNASDQNAPMHLSWCGGATSI